VADRRATPVRAGDEIRSGQTLEVDAGGETVFDYADQTRVTAKEDTRITDFKTAAGKRMRIASGAVRAVVAKQPKGEPMIFETPHGQATVLGTTLRLVVDRDEKKGTRLDVEGGKVELKNLAWEDGDRRHRPLRGGGEPAQNRPEDAPDRRDPIDRTERKDRGQRLWQIVKDPKAATGETSEASREVSSRTASRNSKAGRFRMWSSRSPWTQTRDYHVWVRGCCIATKSPRRAHDSIVLSFPEVSSGRRSLGRNSLPPARSMDTGIAMATGGSEEVGVGPGDVLPPTPAQYTDAVPPPSGSREPESRN
jgi:hypothetical protein